MAKCLWGKFDRDSKLRVPFGNCCRKPNIFITENSETKGQLISKCPYEKSVLSKIPTKKNSEISALASMERSNKKIKALYYTN